jgi:hypothetical protein
MEYVTDPVTWPTGVGSLEHVSRILRRMGWEIHEIPVRDLGSEAQRTERMRLRHGPRQLTQIRRVAWCGRITPKLKGAPVKTPEIRRCEDGPAYLAGLVSCGSVWACPVCAARKRTERAMEAVDLFEAWQEAGGSLVMATLTLPHGVGDRCAHLMALLKAGWRSVFSGRAYRHDPDRFRIAHWYRGWDATFGSNGWHPHLHAVLLVEGRVSSDELAELETRIGARWRTAIVEEGHGKPSRTHGVRLTPGRSAAALAGYVGKAPSPASIAPEASTPHLKLATGRDPFPLLRDAIDGDGRSTRLWHEWERATKGQHFTQWSRGAKSELAKLRKAASGTDRHRHAAESVTVHRFSHEEWYFVRDRPALISRLIELAQGGAPRVQGLLRSQMGLAVGGIPP